MTIDAATLLRERIQEAQDHVLRAVDGLSPEDLSAQAAPSGWSIAGLLSHLTFDDETFWVHAILGGRQEAIDVLQDGWSADASDPVAVLARYRAAVATSREILESIDLDAAPAWWPPREVFPFPAYESGWHVAFHLLTELSTHSGHLDMARERIDGHQHLALG